MIKDALLTCYERDVNPKIVRLWAKLNERITIKVKTGVGESQKVKVGAVVGQGTIGGALVRQAVLDEGVNDKKIFLPQMDKVGFGRGASERNVNSCLKWSKRVQMGPKGSQNT